MTTAALPATTDLEAYSLTARLGFSGPVLPVPPDRASRWLVGDGHQLTHCGDRLGVELLWSELAESVDASAFAGWALKLARNAPARRYLHAEVRPDGEIYLVVVRPGALEAGDVCRRRLSEDLWPELLTIEAVGREHLVLRLADVLGREALTKRFFRSFRRALVEIEGAWLGLGDEDADAFTRRDLAMALLCRLMFITFVSRARGLAGQRSYLRWLIEQPRRGDIFRGQLRPLFFAALNQPPERRGIETRRLGAVPFLNGGLFHPTRAERRNPDLTLPDQLLGDWIHELFECYEFSTQERPASLERPSIDPEMLGHVFEALMHDAERRRSGSFYTPAGLVTDFVRRTLVEWSAERGPSCRAWVAGRLAPARAPEPLERRKRAGLEAALARLLVLDPAVGSGAFLLGVANALVDLRAELAAAESAPAPPSALLRYQLRREVISRNLYGVDIRSGAVRLCELRLWLSLFAEAPDDAPIAPLPNLDHHIRQGDSLVEPRFDLGGMHPEDTKDLSLTTAVRARRDPLERSGAKPSERSEAGGEPSPALPVRGGGTPPEEGWSQRFADLHGDAKTREVRRRREAEASRLKRLLGAELNRIDDALARIRSAEQSRDLFGELHRSNADLKSEQRRLKARRDRLAADDRALDRGEMPWFSYRAAFPEVFQRGAGFDLVIGNPPWVRSHDVPAERRALYRHRYRYAAGRGTGFNRQVDLAVLFVERSLELARPDGLVGLMLPAKVFRAQYGETMRAALVARHRVRQLVDLSQRRGRLFDASNYPAWMLVQARPESAPGGSSGAEGGEPPADWVETSVARPDGSVLASRVEAAKLGWPGGASSPWSALPRRALEALAWMCRSRVTLDTYGLAPRLGIKTGCNPVFLTEAWETHDGQDSVGLVMSGGERLVVPTRLAPLVCRGRDLGAFRCAREARLLLAYDRETARPLRQLPTPLQDYFAKHRGRLLERTDHRASDPLWAVFRTQALVPGPKVVWRDIAPRLEAALLSSRESPIPLNTTYFVTVKDPMAGYLVAALLNSLWMRIVAAVTAEPAMGGYFRFLAWTVAALPWPPRLRVDGRRGRRLAALGREATETGWTLERQAQIDALVARAFDLDAARQRDLVELLSLYPGLVQKEP